MFEMLEVRNDQTAVVSTAGLYQVVAPKKTKKGKWKTRVIGELLSLSEADCVAETYNGCHVKSKKGKLESKLRARVVDYESVYMHCGATFNADADITVYDRSIARGILVARDVHTRAPVERATETA